MDQRLTLEELNVKKFARTTYYQTIIFPKIQDIIIDKQFRHERACQHLGETWKMTRQYLSTKQKELIDELVKKYGRNGSRKLKKIATSPPKYI